MARNAKKGMWMVDEEGRVGITALDVVHGKDGLPVIGNNGARVTEPTFHLVNSLGETYLIQYRGWEGLTQAALAQIPESRRPTPEHGLRFGYV